MQNSSRDDVGMIHLIPFELSHIERQLRPDHANAGNHAGRPRTAATPKTITSPARAGDRSVTPAPAPRGRSAAGGG
ncbi:hypothetical protein, partial [Burkholderia glumae]|uniref:hypothetical protein n=1 Tax=Burkholderia glumae TaxID=337 RepID=UPI0019D6BFA6